MSIEEIIKMAHNYGGLYESTLSEVYSEETLLKDLKEQLTLTDVGEHRVLLEAYTQFLWTQHNNLSNAENNEIALNKFIASNCG
jgi:hypothetical protein